MIRLKRIQPGEQIPIRLTERERKLVLDHTFVGGDLEKRIRGAVADGSAIVVGLNLDDLDELLGYVAAEANHSKNPRIAQQLGHLHERLRRIEERHSDDDEAPSPAPIERAFAPRYTPKQGQYLSFIYYYTKIHGIPPAESDLRSYFEVSPPAVHQMIVTLEIRGLIERVPGKPRAIRLLLSREELPDLE